MNKYILLSVFAFNLTFAQQVFQTSKPYQTKVKKLSEKKVIKRGLELIKDYDSQTLANQIKLSEHQAPAFKEVELGKSALFTQLLKITGLQNVTQDSVGNVIGLYKGSGKGKAIVVAAHLDTVFPEGTDVKTRVKNDTIYGPGIGDDNRGLAVILTIARVFSELKLKTDADILFVGNVGEEGLGDLRGTKYLFNGDRKIDAFISVEPGGIAGITNGALGSHRYKVTIIGPGGHSWGHFGLANPIHALGQAIGDFVPKADDFTRSGAKTSYNVGRIGGGTSVNSIPFSAWVEVDMRSVSQERLKGIDSIFHQSMRAGVELQNRTRKAGHALELKVEMIGDRPSGFTNSDNSLVQWAGATALLFNKTPRLSTSSTDSNIPISLGIPAVTIGGGGTSGASHSLGEWYHNAGGYLGVQRVFLLLAGISQAE